MVQRSARRRRGSTTRSRRLLLADDARTRPVFDGAFVRRWLADFGSGAGRAGGEISRGGLVMVTRARPQPGAPKGARTGGR